MLFAFLKRLFLAMDWDTDSNRSCGCNAIVACIKHSKIYDNIDRELDARGE